MYPECTTVFIAAPSLAEHERRLRERGSESEQGMAERLLIAEVEMQRAPDYDFQLVNDDAHICADELYAILKMRQDENRGA
jgi:guanylate kinase